MDASALGLAFGRSSNKRAMAGALGFVATGLALDVWAARGFAEETGRTFPALA